MVGIRGLSGIKAGNSAAGLVNIDIRPLPIILVGEFAALGNSLRSFRRPLELAVKKVVIPSIDRNFVQGGRPQRWEALSPSTVKRRGGDRSRILQRSGKLRRSATAMARWTFTRESAYAGGAWPRTIFYGPLQHTGFGDQFGSGPWTPSRPFMMIQNEDQAKIEAVFVGWLKANVLVHGFK